MSIANDLIQEEIASVFDNGLQMRYGDVLGPLYSAVTRYRAGSFLELDELRKDLDTEAVPVLQAILHNQVEPPALNAIRSLMIGGAILGDRDAVLRWAIEGANRARQFGGEWAQTLPQWEAVQQDPGRFLLYARQLKYFLQQL